MLTPTIPVNLSWGGAKTTVASAGVSELLAQALGDTLLVAPAKAKSAEALPIKPSFTLLLVVLLALVKALKSLQDPPVATPLAAPQATQVTPKPKKALNLLLEGDSLTASQLGYGNTITTRYAASDKTVSVTNQGGNGHTIAGNMLPEAVANANRLDRNKENIVVLYAGTNDIYFGAKSAPTYDKLVDMAKIYKDKGWKVLVVTATQRADAHDAERLSFNNKIRANAESGPWDKVLDLGASKAFSDTDNSVTNDRSIFIDTVHLTAKGNQLVADAIQSAVESLRT